MRETGPEAMTKETMLKKSKTAGYCSDTFRNEWSSHDRPPLGEQYRIVSQKPVESILARSFDMEENWQVAGLEPFILTYFLGGGFSWEVKVKRDICGACQHLGISYVFSLIPIPCLFMVSTRF